MTWGQRILRIGPGAEQGEATGGGRRYEEGRGREPAAAAARTFTISPPVAATYAVRYNDSLAQLS
jgi:hypothetical protein